MHLSSEEWLHATYPKVEVESSRLVITELVKLIKTSFPRTDNDGAIVGQGWKFPKMHVLTKFVDYIILFGSSINVFGGIEECNHKKFVKTPDVIHRKESTRSPHNVPLDTMRV